MVAVVVEVGRAGSSALARAALDWIDDPVGLLGDRPVPTAELWRDLFAAAVGGRCESLVIVHPDDWSWLRVRVVRRAAESVAGRVATCTETAYRSRSAPKTRSVRSLGVVAAAVLLAGGAAALTTRSTEPPKAVTLLDGPVAVLIPPDWTVERHTGGRVRIGSPTDAGAAVNIIWTYAPETTLAEVAGTLRRAAAAEPAGVFDFTAETSGRPAVAYRETRPGTVVRWSVLLDGSTRIAVGCQSAPDREFAVRAACDQAVRSARAF